MRNLFYSKIPNRFSHTHRAVLKYRKRDYTYLRHTPFFLFYTEPHHAECEQRYVSLNYINRNVISVMN
jgi:hypothetical protein